MIVGEAKAANMPELYDSLDGNWDYMTVGKGKAQYHFYTVGPIGVYYLYRQFPQTEEDPWGYLGAKRKVELTETIKFHKE